MAAGTLPMFCASAAEIPAVVMHLSAMQWEVLMALALGTTVLSTLCWNIGSAILGAEKAGWFLYLLPVVSLAGGAMALGEPVTLVEFFGGGLIMLSVFLSQRAK
jgi:drug/metabolite transporter (DMT)-like permease